MNRIVKKKKLSSTLTKNNILLASSFNKLKENFNKNNINKMVQNLLCSNDLHKISEVREYMQSLNYNFSHVVEPVLSATDQGDSDRCWMFAILNLIRHELIKNMNLPYDFELSGNYLSFYDKMEKCNYFLVKFMNSKDIEEIEDNTNVLSEGLSDGGNWVTCFHLIQKYGLVPKSCYSECSNSFSTNIINTVISIKLREFALLLIKEDKKKRPKLKDEMMEQIYQILSKMLGTPPCPDESFDWHYSARQSMDEILKKEQQRVIKDKYNTLQNKKIIRATPLDFYKRYICNNLDDYYSFSHDPRKKYNTYYKYSYEDIMTCDGKQLGCYNISIDELSQLCINSILDNTPVHFECDATHYLHREAKLFDPKCVDYSVFFGIKFDSLTKEETLRVHESDVNHAMLLVGVDLDENKNPIKWKVENSWGQQPDTSKDNTNTNDYYTMSHDWFKKYVYNIIILRDYVDQHLRTIITNAKKR